MPAFINTGPTTGTAIREGGHDGCVGSASHAIDRVHMSAAKQPAIGVDAGDVGELQQGHSSPRQQSCRGDCAQRRGRGSMCGGTTLIDASYLPLLASVRGDL